MSTDHKQRTPNQKMFDRGVMATAELCRRLTKDESLAYALLAMTTGGLLDEDRRPVTEGKQAV